MAYIGSQPGVSSQRLETAYYATSGQTTFIAPAGYVPGNIDVFLNGTKLLNGVDFTASNGIAIVLTEAAALNDEVVLLAYIPRGLSDGYTKSEADAKYLTIANPSYTGTLTGGTGVINIGSGQLYKNASGNLGIGTTDVASLFSSDRFIRLSTTSAKASYEVISLDGTNNHRIGMFVNNTAGLVGFDTGSSTGNYGGISFLIEGTEAVRIDRSRNLGLGVTPSAWSGFTSLDVKGGVSFTSWQGYATGGIYQNTYFDGAYRYKTTNFASRFALNDGNAGGFQWDVAPSGTAGSSFTFTRAMTLNANGDLLLGTTSSGGNGITLDGLRQLNFTGGSSYAQFNNYRGLDLELVNRTAGTGIAFYVGAASLAGKFDSSGNLLVAGGVANAGYGKVFSIGAQSGADGRVTIASGVLNSAYGAVIYPSNRGIEFDNNSSVRDYYFTKNNGAVFAPLNASAFNVSSDYRLKENIVPITDAIARVMALKPRRFNFIEGSMMYRNGEAVDGFLAHEVTPLVPEAVTGEKDAFTEDGKILPQALDQAKLVPVLTAAIQEQQALIASLTSRLEALEAA